MCHLENKVFETQPDLRPIIYCRYVDDIFVLAKNIDQVLKLRDSFTNNSALIFSYELDEKSNFLDVTVTRRNDKLLTFVYIKPIYDNQTFSYVSITPLKYKLSTIKTILHCGFAASGFWSAFHADVTRIKCLLNNINFPIKLIYKEIKKFVSSKVKIIEKKVKVI